MQVSHMQLVAEKGDMLQEAETSQAIWRKERMKLETRLRELEKIANAPPSTADAKTLENENRMLKMEVARVNQLLETESFKEMQSRLKESVTTVKLLEQKVEDLTLKLKMQENENERLEKELHVRLEIGASVTSTYLCLLKQNLSVIEATKAERERSVVATTYAATVEKLQREILVGLLVFWHKVSET